MELAFMTLGKEKELLKTESWYTHACLQERLTINGELEIQNLYCMPSSRIFCSLESRKLSVIPKL